MKKWQLTFKRQVLVGIGLIILSGILSQVFHHGIFHNIAWILYGLLFIFHPVWPEGWDYGDPARVKKSCRIGGAICILIGLMIRFGV